MNGRRIYPVATPGTTLIFSPALTMVTACIAHAMRGNDTQVHANAYAT